MSQKYIDKLKRFDLLILSLDGNKEVHESIRGKRSYEKLVRAVEIAKEHNLTVAAMLTLTTKNFPVLKEALEFSKKNKILQMVGTLQEFGEDQVNLFLSRDQIEKYSSIY